MGKPQTGILFAIHLIIVGIRWIRKNPLSFFILATVISLVLFTTQAVFVKSFKYNSTTSLIRRMFICDSKTYHKNKNKVILRLDDVANYTWGDTTHKMIIDTVKLKMPMSLGVIPMSLEKNLSLVSLIKDKRCDLEIVLHGWNHREDVPEFSNINKLTAIDKLTRGKEYLEDLFSTKIVTFIPPQNSISKEAESALGELEFQVLSSEGTDYLDYDASTYDFDENKLVSVEKVIKDCQIAFVQDNICVIMLHPHDYATDFKLDTVKYKEYLRLLQSLEKLNVSFTTFRDVAIADDRKGTSK